jgi:hypothetical protein
LGLRPERSKDRTSRAMNMKEALQLRQELDNCRSPTLELIKRLEDALHRQHMARKLWTCSTCAANAAGTLIKHYIGR